MTACISVEVATISTGLVSLSRSKAIVSTLLRCCCCIFLTLLMCPVCPIALTRCFWKTPTHDSCCKNNVFYSQECWSVKSTELTVAAQYSRKWSNSAQLRGNHRKPFFTNVWTVTSVEMQCNVRTVCGSNHRCSYTSMNYRTRRPQLGTWYNPAVNT